QLILSLLERYFKALNEDARLEKRIVVHYFEHIAMFIDAYIFNNVMKNPQANASRALQIKMSVSFLANWFEDNGVKAVSDERKREEEGSHMQEVLFPLSRQLADACVIGQQSLLTDNSTRQMVCPSMSDVQIAHLLSSYVPEEFD